MSTRSGKRLHSSLHENTVKDELEMGTKSEKKTRAKKLKENVNKSDLSVAICKKRNNYVTYPTDAEMMVDAVAPDSSESKPTRKLLRNTLKDHNLPEPATENPNINTEVKKVIRLTRSTKKFAENVERNSIEMHENSGDTLIMDEKLKTKKGKKKTKTISNQEDDSEVAQVKGNGPNIKKSKRKKKKGKRSSDFIEDDIVKKDVKLNKNNTSTDSYYSAAGSPQKMILHDNDVNIIDCNKSGITHTIISPEILIEDLSQNISVLNKTLQNESKRKSSLKNTTFDKFDNDTTVVPINLNSTFDKSKEEITDRLNTTFEKQNKTRKSLSEKTETKNGILNSTFEMSEKLNATFEKKTRNSTSSQSESENLNATFEKATTDTNTAPLNSTYDKVTDKKLDTTFDKTEPQNMSISAKSSLTSSNNTINVTFDKSNISHISITSDESRAENIVNTTPLLIESSLEDSRISDNLSTTENLNTPEKDNKKESLTVPVAITPLKRENTFTKDGPDVNMVSPRLNVSSEKTPTKKMSLPSPGFTPFHITRSSQREKSVLNVTRSIECSTRRSSLVDLAPRQTKVMFCSPPNTPGVSTQQKRKIIKSSLKGSKKSFVFDESASDARPVNRKRSFSSGPEPGRAKRSRLGEEMLLSVERLSRPRTWSAAAKLNDNTPKEATPMKAKPSANPARTKLPNFAALHQKEFARMESLDECQQRRARRARELITPRANAPKGKTEKPKPVPNTNAKDTKKLETPANAITTVKPTLESLRPGFTRFGFKMHIEGNPFTVNSKFETKPKENKPNGSRLPAILPSKKGTTLRKEAAKQVIMREKSSSSLSNKREVKRKEDRTIIKGVRTNRRFELQMQMRNIN